MSARGSLRSHRGFVLIAVLWVTAIVGALVLTVAVRARETTAVVENHRLLEAAMWNGIGCINRTRALLESELRAGGPNASARAAWQTAAAALKERIATELPDCHLKLVSAGSGIDVNRASTETMLRYFESAGVGAERHDLVDALKDWIDADDEVRSQGAEEAWYLANGAIPPRNGPVQDVRELRFVRGFSALNSSVLAGLATDSGPVVLTTASPTVLQALPGIGAQLALTLHERSSRGHPVAELRDLERLATPLDAELFRANFPTLAALATVDPDAWHLRVVVTAGLPALRRLVEARVVRDGHRTAVVDWRVE